MNKVFEFLLDLIYRKKCYFCGKHFQSLKMCPECFAKLEFNTYIPNRIINGINVYCAGIYTKDLQKLIRGLKYHQQKDLAYYQAKYMYDYFINTAAFENKEYILAAVPLHPNRIKKRKYNHMELVCEEFSKLSGYPCRFDIIKRIKDTKPQYNLNRKERMTNLSNAFEVSNEPKVTQPILLMDDICTTGSTFEEMISALKSAGINEIVCFATSSPI